MMLLTYNVADRISHYKETVLYYFFACLECFTIKIVSLRADSFKQAVESNLLEQSDQSVHCLLFQLSFLDTF